MKRNTAKGSQEKDILLNALLTLVLITVVGLISNVLILLMGWCITLPAFATGLAHLNDRLLWFFLALISQIFCTVMDGYLLTFVGSSAAQYRIGNKLSYRLNSTAMLLSVGLGIFIHGLVCLGTCLIEIAYLYFAGPIPYIARFLAGAERSMFASDTDAVITLPVLLLSVLLYCALCMAGCCVGYRWGHNQAIRLQQEKERQDSRTIPESQIWSAADANQASRVAQFGQFHEHIRHKTLPRAMEKAYRQLNTRRIVKTVLCILLYLAADALFCWLWISSRENPRLSVDTMPFIALAVVPFYPMGLHKRLLGKTTYATVAAISSTDKTQPAFVARRGMRFKVTHVITIRPDNGVPEQLKFPEQTQFDLRPDDRVLKLSAYPHPVPTWSASEPGTYCPKCGHTTRSGSRCSWCRERLARYK